MKALRGHDAVRIMIEEIGAAIGQKRLREFEIKVRGDLAKRSPDRVTAREWIGSMANVIVDDDDARANAGFEKGIRRIRSEAAGQDLGLILPH